MMGGLGFDLRKNYRIPLIFQEQLTYFKKVNAIQ